MFSLSHSSRQLARRWAALALLAVCSGSAVLADRLVVLDAGHASILDALGVADQVVLAPLDPTLEGRLLQAERFHRTVSAESLIALRPDWLIISNPAREADLQQHAQRLNIPTVVIERTLPAIERIQRLAELTATESQAQPLIDSILLDYAQAEARVAEREPLRVLHVSSGGAGSSGSVTGAGAGTSAHGLIERAGGINVGAEAGLERYQSLSAEGVIQMAPEVVVVSNLELPALGGRDGVFERVPGLAYTPAALNQRLVVLDHAAIKFDADSSGEATLALARALYPTAVTEAGQ
ncbi:hypothetical protein BGP77_12280 [Saccharospirillum sp. MSK14-1]|uniref:ABC transporter substrate-binding protein n=1 Tax=Saccharospirillum sp. MSK14-1 TaxID=1897632 RepID=UPI000D4884B3|nr:ABC transporter substrate-binding protein [Saccharospirillum sp. MSK14-1]PTY38479.1 hypothetical protein BGP77_12280 [Saccharospirillum sp. MSK14-1]